LSTCRDRLNPEHPRQLLSETCQLAEAFQKFRNTGSVRLTKCFPTPLKQSGDSPESQRTRNSTSGNSCRSTGSSPCGIKIRGHPSELPSVSQNADPPLVFPPSGSKPPGSG